jgi:hypothetical protein
MAEPGPEIPTGISPSVKAMRNLGGISPSVEKMRKLEWKSELPDIRMQLGAGTGLSKESLFERDLREQIEHTRAFERSAEAAVERVEVTTVPQEVRASVRDAIYAFIDAPVGLGDQWGMQRLYSELEDRERFLRRSYSGQDAVARVYGLDIEPWRAPRIITEEQRLDIARRGLEDFQKRAQSSSAIYRSFIQQVKGDVEWKNRQWEEQKEEIGRRMAAEIETEMKKTIRILEREAKERLPFLRSELLRSQGELSRTRRIVFMWWNWRNCASGSEAGQWYMDSKIPNYPAAKDFALLFQDPAHVIPPEEVVKITTGNQTDIKKAGDFPHTPLEEDIPFATELEGRTENLPIGKSAEKEVRLFLLISLSEDPEKVMNWKLKAEKAALYKIIIKRENEKAMRSLGIAGQYENLEDVDKKRVDEATEPLRCYLILKKKGIDYQDAEEEKKISETIRTLTEGEEKGIRDAWWKQFGFKGEEDGRAQIGDPEMWIPRKARRGEPPANLLSCVEPGFDIESEKARIEAALRTLKKQWEDLSPLNNLSLQDQEKMRKEIEKTTDLLRELSTGKVGGRLVSTFSSLSLEKELRLRKGPLEFGCVWARPQFAGEFDELFKVRLVNFVGKDKLAFEEGQAIAGLWGFPAKNGVNVRNYDPEQPRLKQWSVDVEAWPYTSEFQNILAFDKYALYKGEAGGPPGSRGLFGPLMTDYLTANVVHERDKNGNELFIIMDENGKLRKGRADEGLIIADTTSTLMDHCQEGESLGNEELWAGVVDKDGEKGVLQDPARRYLLRGFFAHGRAALGPGGDELLSLWRRRDWKLDELDSDKFWDDYFLDRKVALREELFEEDIWVDITAPIDREYRQNIAKLANRLKAATGSDDRQRIIRENAALYHQWRANRKQAVFDYSDITFGNGIRSSDVFESWIRKEAQIPPEERRKAETLETVLKRIYQRAISHGIKIARSEAEFMRTYEER